MKTFTVTFKGRLRGSLDIFSLFVVEVKAEDIFSAVSALYKTHEHIRLVTHSEIAA